MNRGTTLIAFIRKPLMFCNANGRLFLLAPNKGSSEKKLGSPFHDHHYPLPSSRGLSKNDGHRVLFFFIAHYKFFLLYEILFILASVEVMKLDVINAKADKHDDS